MVILFLSLTSACMGYQERLSKAGTWKDLSLYLQYWVGQKVHSGFSVRHYVLVEESGPLLPWALVLHKEESEVLPVAREFTEDERTDRTPQRRWAKPRKAVAPEGWGAEFFRQVFS